MAGKVDIVALGELLIDFTEAGFSANGQKLFEQNPGGAPANLLTVASHFGFQTAFIGKIGKDMQGEFLKKSLQSEQIDTRALVEDENYFTTLAFVELDKNGERKFSFARKPGADTQLRKDELDRELLQHCKIFHFGSLSLTEEPSRSATLEALKEAKRHGALISYDPNYRARLWENEKTAVASMQSVIPVVDVMKVSEEELLLLTEEPDYEKAALKILKQGPRIVAVTLGEKGAMIATQQHCETVKATPVEKIANGVPAGFVPLTATAPTTTSATIPSNDSTTIAP